jgi:phage baseplate assembly protein W
MADRIFYRDLPLDIKITSNGDISEVVNADSIKQSLRMIVDTARGSRVFFPEFGCRVNAFLFEPFDEATARRLGEELQTTIVNYEKRINLLNLNVQMDFTENSYEVDVVYRVITTGEVDNLQVSLEKL